MLAAARLRHIAGTQYGTNPYLNMKRLEDLGYRRLKEEEPDRATLTEEGAKNLLYYREYTFNKAEEE